jgi:hypothetical protein
MMEGDVTGMVAQLGAAGLMGWMWLSERRAAGLREKQLAEAHERLMQERNNLEVLLRAVESSTRTLTALEVGQRQVVELLGRVARVVDAALPRARGGAGGRRRAGARAAGEAVEESRDAVGAGSRGAAGTGAARMD